MISTGSFDFSDDRKLDGMWLSQVAFAQHVTSRPVLALADLQTDQARSAPFHSFIKSLNRVVCTQTSKQSAPVGTWLSAPARAFRSIPSRESVDDHRVSTLQLELGLHLSSVTLKDCILLMSVYPICLSHAARGRARGDRVPAGPPVVSRGVRPAVRRGAERLRRRPGRDLRGGR